MSRWVSSFLFGALAALVAACSDAREIEGFGHQAAETQSDPEIQSDSGPAEAAASEGTATKPVEDVTPPSSAATAESPSGFVAKVKFKGRESFSIKPMADGAKLVDGAELELARYSIREGLRVKVKDRGDAALGQIKGDAAKIHIEDDQGKRIYALQRQADGDYKLEGPNGQLIYKIKTRPYGLKIERADGAEVAKVKAKSGKTSLRDAEDTTLLSTKGQISNLAMACLGLSEITQALRVGLAVRIQAEGL